MNLRCSFCQTPFTIGRVEKLDALQHMDANTLNHYDAHCPRCRRATPVMRQKLEMTLPNWRDALKELEKEMAAHPQQEAPPASHKTEPAPAADTESKLKPATKPAPRSRKKAATKTVEKKSTPKGKTAAKKKK